MRYAQGNQNKGQCVHPAAGNPLVSRVGYCGVSSVRWWSSGAGTTLVVACGVVTRTCNVNCIWVGTHATAEKFVCGGSVGSPATRDMLYFGESWNNP